MISGNAVPLNIGDSATSSRERATAAAALRERLRDQSRTALEMLHQALAPLELLGGGKDELRPLCERLERQLANPELVIAVAGQRRRELIETLVGAPIIPAEPRVPIRLHAGAEVSFEARWPDGRSEGPPRDESESRQVHLESLEMQIVAETELTRRHAQALQDAARSATQARVQLTEVKRDLTAMRTPSPAPDSGSFPEVEVFVVQPEPPPAPVAAPLPAPRRSLLARAFGWLWSLVRRLFGQAPKPALAAPPPPAPAPPAPPPPAPVIAPVTAPPVETPPQEEETLAAGSPRGMAILDQRVAEEAQRLAPVAQQLAQLEEELKASKARLAAHLLDRERQRRELDRHRAERLRAMGQRLIELTAGRPGSPEDVLIAVPGLPKGVSLVILPGTSALGADPIDATLLALPGSPPDDGPMLHVQDPTSRSEIDGHLQRARDERPANLSRRVVAALFLCKNRILDLDRRARQAHQARLDELTACRIQGVDAARQKEQAVAAQRTIPGHAEQIVAEAVSRLERLMKEARKAWEQRIDSCSGIEQLRAEVAAIESGAAHRLSLVCDELREHMTVQCARLILELSRPLRQELLRSRLEIARGQTAQMEESFAGVRMVLPNSLEETFGALRAPGVGELMDRERGLFDPLFRTLAREKKQCIAKLDARLDESERTTVRDLFAAAVYLSPLLSSTLSRALEGMLTAHSQWIDVRSAEEQVAFTEEQARHAPALALVPLLQQQAANLAGLLEG
jgi:hypothetical protein